MAGRAGVRALPGADGRPVSSGPSTRGRPPPTACPGCITSRPGSSRTSFPGSRPCRASMCPARAAGTATACRSRWRSRRNSGCPARRTSRPTASPPSTSAAASRCSGMWTRSRSSPSGSATGSTWPARTGPWTPAYIESVWWSLQVIFDKGLLVRDYRISPYCPRCETPLSDHEMGQPDVYEMVTDPSVTVRFPLVIRARRGRPAAGGRRPAGVDDHAVDAGVQHRRRPFTRTRPTWSPARPATGTGWWSPRRCCPGCSAKAGTSWPGCGGPTWQVPATSRRSAWSTSRVRTWW